MVWNDGVTKRLIAAATLSSLIFTAGTGVAYSQAKFTPVPRNDVIRVMSECMAECHGVMQSCQERMVYSDEARLTLAPVNTLLACTEPNVALTAVGDHRRRSARDEDHRERIAERAEIGVEPQDCASQFARDRELPPKASRRSGHRFADEDMRETRNLVAGLFRVGRSSELEIGTVAQRTRA
jgi:hypothetical protein